MSAGLIMALVLGGLALGGGVWQLALRRNAREIARARQDLAAARLAQAATEAALKANRDRLEEFSEAAADWLWEIDAEYRFVMDTGRSQAGGLNGADLLGLKRWEMPGTDPADPVWQRYRDLLDARQSFRDFQFSYRGSTGRLHHASISGHPLFGANGAFLGYRGTARDTTAQVEAKEKIDQANALFDAVRQIQSSYIAGVERNAASEQMLSVFLQLTGSAFGFLGEMHSDGDERYLKVHAMSDISWDEASRKLYNQSRANGFEFRKMDSLFGAVIRTEQAVIANSPAEDTRAGGIPRGHPSLDSFLGIPLFAGKTMLGMVGLANRAGGYDRSIVDFLEPLTGACGAVIAAIQANAEQQRVAQELRRSDERLQLTLESTGVGPWEWNLRKDIYRFDPATARKLGYAPGEIAPTSKAWDALMHPDDLAAVNRQFEALDAASGDTFETVYRMRLKQGGWRWLLSRGRIVHRDADGRPVKMIGTHLDITAVKETEIALRRSEARFRALAESSRAVPWEADVGALRITYVGPQIEKIAGFSPTDWVEQDLWPQRLHPEDRDRVIREGEQRAAEGIDHNLEYRLIAADGRVVWIRDLISVITGDAGQKVLYGVMVDITEEKMREQALRESESRYRQAERVARIIHWNATPGRTPDWADARLTFSETAARFFAVEPQHLDLTIGEFAERFVHPDDRARLRQEFDRCSTARVADYSLEYRIVRQDGVIAIVSEIGQRNYDAAGRMMTSFGTIQDITDRKQTENALRRAQMEAEMANRAKSQFLANVSHELRTPLNAIIGFSEVMKDELMGPLGAPVYREYSGDIHESGRHLLAIINDILDLSRVEAGQTTITEGEISVAGLIESCLMLVRGKANANGLSLSAEIPPALPQVLGDERLLKQALLNLLSNAVKFTPKGGSVRVKATLGHQGLDIAVTDSGIGMSAADIEQVAKPFVQLENWLVRKYEGTGLGLSIVKAFCELHGGALRIESELGKGTVTTIRLPADRIIAEQPRNRAHAE